MHPRIPPACPERLDRQTLDAFDVRNVRPRAVRRGSRVCVYRVLEEVEHRCTSRFLRHKDPAQDISLMQRRKGTQTSYHRGPSTPSSTGTFFTWLVHPTYRLPIASLTPHHALLQNPFMSSAFSPIFRHPSTSGRLSKFQSTYVNSAVITTQFSA
jgi:hypothetical protein